MRPIIKERFRASLPNVSFPWYETLSDEETRRLRGALKAKLGLGEDASDLELMKEIEHRGVELPEVNPLSGEFDLGAVLSRHSSPDSVIYLNWYRFDEVDRMTLRDLAAHLHDIWLSAHDADVFDPQLKWILTLHHYGAANLLELD